MSSIDMNVDNYSIPDLLVILQLDSVDPDEIESVSNSYIEKFEKQGDSEMSDFFRDVQEKLLTFYSSNEKGIDQQTQDWFDNEALQQPDSIQRDKNTDRKQKIDVYSNDHVPMNRQQLGVANNVTLPVSQDRLNPNLKNITERLINLDSQFRQSGSTTSTDYTLDLSDPLHDVLSLRLFSFQIPVSWYVFDDSYGNTCFWIEVNNGNLAVVPIYLKPGNYSNGNTLADSLNQSFKNAGFSQIEPFVSYDASNGKITFFFSPFLYVTRVIFFDPNSELQCKTSCVNTMHYVNQTLGWALGFREPFLVFSNGFLSGDSVVDLIGPRYLILVVDDYNQNHINNGLVSIAELSKVVKLPSYYSADLMYDCVPATVSMGNDYVPGEDAYVWADKISTTYQSRQRILPNAPRTLTQSQIYTINEIIKNNDQTTNYLGKAPTTSDVFALIPIKGGLDFGTLYTEISGSLQAFKRTYFGPVDIDRMRITLQDDKGRQLNLNGCDWSITLISENLYQY
jgi:hypothetical protein